MQNINDVIECLRRIKKAMGYVEYNPLMPPAISRNQKHEQASPLAPIFHTPEEFDYPDYVEFEYFQAIDRDYAERGIEALAWYVSFHNGGPWGIYIPVLSLAYIENRFLKRYRGTRFRKWQLGYDLLLQHEMFHFATDYMCAQWEILLQAPCWSALTDYRKREGIGYLEIEEKLANAYMLRQLNKQLTPSGRRLIRTAVECSPPGYKDGAACVDDLSFKSNLAELTKVYVAIHALEKDINLLASGVDITAFYSLADNLDANQCPITIIHNEDRFGIPQIGTNFILKIPTIVETEAFQKACKKLDKSLRQRWEKKKRLLAETIPRHPEFEKFADLFSLRLNDNYRVHLRPSNDMTVWEAIAVGTHKEMGHG